MQNSIKLLPIETELSQKLIDVLDKFDSYRIGNDIVKEVEEKKQPLEENIVVEPERKAKRSLSFLERLFITEYTTPQ